MPNAALRYPDRDGRHIIGDYVSALLLAHFQSVYLNSHTLRGTLALVTGVDHVLVDGVEIVGALEEGRDFLLVIDAAKPSLTSAHPVHRAEIGRPSGRG